MLGRLAVKVLVPLVVLLVAAAVGEAVLRLKNRSMTNYDIEMWRYTRLLATPSDNPVLGHEQRPNAAAVLQQVELRTEDNGLRGAPVGPAERRVLFLGSSVTLGWGVEESDTLTERLEAALRARGESVEVLNAGIANYNAVRYVERFFSRLKDLQPTDIVVHYFLNDAEVLPPPQRNWLLRNSQLAFTAWLAARRLLGRFGARAPEVYYRALYAPESEGYAAMRESLSRLGQYAQERGIRMYMAIMPDIHALEDYRMGFVHDAMSALGRELGYQVIDLYPVFRGLTAQDIWSLPGDPHPNALGHQRMAEALLPLLQR